MAAKKSSTSKTSVKKKALNQKLKVQIKVK